MWAVVGLGNPGRRYSGTRHNAGFLFVRSMAKTWKIRLKKRRFSSKIGEVERKSEKIMLALPQNYMNNSGVAVKQILAGRNIRPEKLIVVYDDLDIPLGEIRIRKAGGAGTHKGMGSVVREIETTEFPRMRLGIGPLPPGEDAVDYVLSAFEKREIPLLVDGLKKAQEALELILAGSVEEAMNTFNQRGKTAAG
ncbi:MAG: aminoacyl-tRNA hydrolase [Candidatus Aminicenantes bacterium]|nr:MAG: aminoacyl-tRNA hydrolase [Candidatus Aminicenantes bacterium]